MSDARRAAAALALMAAAAASPAAEEPAGLTFDLSLSRAASSSPVYRFSPDGALVRLDGRNRLSGSLLELAVAGQRDWALADEWRPSLALRADRSLSRQAPDLQIGQLWLDATLRRPLGSGMAGAGMTLQRLWVAGATFRSTRGLHLDWTRSLGEGSHLMLVHDRARYRHGAGFADLDAAVQQLSANVRIGRPWPGVDGLDLDLGWRRENNRRGQPDLSLLGRHLRVGIDRALGRWGFGSALMLSRAAYRAGIDGWLPARREQSLSVEGSASLAMGEGSSLRLQALWARNRARPALYDNRHRSLGLGYAASW